ncbi:unnamed protein product [Chilo suppressalis]|uniref:FLYWCH-type domain-containing protein n=1 Tax=Chilo suppressalis TaxID=168631 RepID=A0ABN8AY03_CHISP|nr:unnamed protein product [Chilo suppressalis]
MSKGNAVEMLRPSNTMSMVHPALKNQYANHKFRFQIPLIQVTNTSGDILLEAFIIPSKFKRAKSKGNGMLLYKGYTYSWRNRKKRGNYWTCSSHQKKGCSASVSTDESKKPFIITHAYDFHTHPPVGKSVYRLEDIEFE